MRFSASVFFVYQPHMTPESYSKRFSNSVSNRNTPNLGYESEIHMKSIYEKKLEAKNLVLLSFQCKFLLPLRQTIVKIVFR
jgi:hypothetical protein